jgi:hypothetical protein
MAKDKQKAQSKQLALCLAKLLDLHDMLCGSKSPVPTSKLVSSLQPKAGLSRASQVFFQPPTPAPTSDSNDNMDTANIADPNPTITIPAHTPSLPQNHNVVMERVDGNAFMGNFEDSEAFFVSFVFCFLESSFYITTIFATCTTHFEK